MSSSKCRERSASCSRVRPGFPLEVSDICQPPFFCLCVWFRSREVRLHYTRRGLRPPPVLREEPGLVRCLGQGQNGACITCDLTRGEPLTFQENPYSPALFLAAVVSLAVAVYSVGHRRTPGAGAMALMMFSAGLWSVGYALEIGSLGFAQKIFWAKIQYLGICALPYSVAAFGVAYSGRRLGGVWGSLLAVLPLFTLGLVFTNERHGLIWSSVSEGPGNLFLDLEHGPAFWIFWVYSYVLVVTGLALITTVIFRSQRLYLMQSLVLILGLLVPWLGNSIYVLGLLPADPNFDLTPLGFTVTGLLLAWGLFRFGLLDMVPVAHHRIVESINDAVFVLDSRGRILDLNPATATLLNVPVPLAVGRKAGEAIVGLEDLPETANFETRAGNPERDYEVSLTPLERKPSRMLKGTTPGGLVVIFRDVSERKKAERKLKASEERYRRLVEMSPDAIIVHSAGVVDYINAAGVRSVGASTVGDLVGRSVLDLVHPDYADRMAERLRRTYEDDYESAAEEKFVRLDGRVMDVETAVMSVSRSGVPVSQLVFREITERKVAEERLTHQAFHDLLTGLPNRSFFTRKLSVSLESGTSGRVGVLFLDLDGFKLVNDSLGHEYGDSLLCAVAERLRSCVRPEDTAARMGGDEFTVLLEDLHDEAEVEVVASRIASSLSRPFVIADNEVSITASIGIALGASGESAASEMLRNADAAMYEAKRAGGVRYRVFREGMSDASLRDLRLRNELRRAVREGEFVVHYQPKVSLPDGGIAGLEALLRWQHPEKGLLGPRHFIPAAEEAGLMTEIGVSVLGDILRQLSLWSESLPGSPPVTVGVNISARQIRHPALVARTLALLEENGLSPLNLELEVTEDAFIGRDESALLAMNRLREAGVKLSVDDFGTGYSSLSRLRNVPIDTIKIDGALISGLDHDPEGYRIVSGLIELAHALGKSVVAESVESRAQLDRLIELGCDFAQGNYFWKPLEAPEAFRLLTGRRPPGGGT
nr:EAL domain-containing protein [Rubrobacter indicoceani]